MNHYKSYFVLLALLVVLFSAYSCGRGRSEKVTKQPRYIDLTEEQYVGVFVGETKAHDRPARLTLVVRPDSTVDYHLVGQGRELWIRDYEGVYRVDSNVITLHVKQNPVYRFKYARDTLSVVDNTGQRLSGRDFYYLVKQINEVPDRPECYLYKTRFREAYEVIFMDDLFEEPYLRVKRWGEAPVNFYYAGGDMSYDRYEMGEEALEVRRHRTQMTLHDGTRYPREFNLVSPLLYRYYSERGDTVELVFREEKGLRYVDFYRGKGKPARLQFIGHSEENYEQYADMQRYNPLITFKAHSIECALANDTILYHEIIFDPAE